jgi:hypothetical protein
MNQNHFGTDTTFPPPPPPPVPVWPPHQPPGPPPARPARGRRWPMLAAAGAIAATVASLAAAAITLSARDTGPTQAHATSSPVTITVAAPTPAAPAPLPTAEADRQTCQNGWVQAGNLIRSAQDVLSVLPPDVKVGDPAATSNPQWASSVQRAADLYTRASAALDGSIAPGATPVLSEAARTSVRTLRVLGEAIRTSDPITGNAVTMANESTQLTGALCVRLA